MAGTSSACRQRAKTGCGSTFSSPCTENTHLTLCCCVYDHKVEESLDWGSYLGLGGELCLKLRQNPQSQQADLREKQMAQENKCTFVPGYFVCVTYFRNVRGQVSIQDLIEVQQGGVRQVLWNPAEGQACVVKVSEEQGRQVCGKPPVSRKTQECDFCCHTKRLLTTLSYVPQDWVDLVHADEGEGFCRAVEREEAAQGLSHHIQTSCRTKLLWVQCSKESARVMNKMNNK